MHDICQGNKPRLLDLFSCQGGAARGYQMAGFHVTGVDLEAQPRYCGDEFHQGDALEYLAAHWQGYDAFHASPPCQGYSIMNNLPWLRHIPRQNLILATREAFQRIHAESGKPWVIENVEGARYGAPGLTKRGLEAHGMQAGYLCGTMFGLRVYRHRLFETSFLWLAPAHQKHRFRQGMPGAPKPRGAWEEGFEAAHPGESQQASDQNAIVEAVFNGHDDRPFWKRDHGPFFERRSEASKAQIVESAYGDSRTPGQRGIHGKGDVQTKKESLAARQQGNSAQAPGVGVGHAAGWRLAAEAMECLWMDRHGVTQAIPPRMATFIGKEMLKYIAVSHRPAL